MIENSSSLLAPNAPTGEDGLVRQYGIPYEGFDEEIIVSIEVN
jgi:hypothetical protein